jgi:archaellum biogenesis ATPase FlaH
MKHEKYLQQLESLKEFIIDDLVKGCLNVKALEIDYHHPILHAYIDDQHNQVIARLNVEQQHVVIDDSYRTINIKLDDLTLDELLGLLREFEEGHYEIWEVVGD